MRCVAWWVGSWGVLAQLAACGPEAQPPPAAPATPIPSRLSKAGNPIYRVHPRDPQLLQLAGEKALAPDGDAIRSEQLQGKFELCVDETGHYESGSIVESTGSPGYDAKIARALMGWVYRPYLVGGVAVPVCTTITFRYSYGRRRP